MKYALRIVSTNTEASKTGLMVIFENMQYVFNVPDGF